jgi:DNA-binding NarL/FixJ family response regulator
MSLTRLLIVDDHEIFREGLAAILGQEGGFTIAGSVGDARAACEILPDAHPQVIILDVMMPGRNGLSVIRDLRRIDPAAQVLVLSAHGAHDFVRQALAAGARGYAMKSSRLAELVNAIRTVASGGTYLAPGLPRWMLETAEDQLEDGPLATLSPREREVFDLVVRGYSTNGIAGALFISVKTVETHRAHINRKLGVHSSADLLRLAARHGILAE